MHACMHACMYVCMYVCVYVRMYVCIIYGQVQPTQLKTIVCIYTECK